MDQKVKEYFLSGTRKITKVIPCNGYVLTLEFDNGELKTFDMSENSMEFLKYLKIRENLGKCLLTSTVILLGKKIKAFTLMLFVTIELIFAKILFLWPLLL